MSVSRRRVVVLGALGLAGVVPRVRASAPQGAGGEPPRAVREAVPGAREVGSGRLRFFGLHVYDARLWAGAGFVPQAYEEHPFALQLTYARALAGADIARRSLTEMQRGVQVDDDSAARWLAAMRETFPDVAPGDALLGLHLPGRGARFVHNGTSMREIRDPTFATAFFGIWLAPWTSEPGLRAMLLAGAEGSTR